MKWKLEYRHKWQGQKWKVKFFPTKQEAEKFVLENFNGNYEWFDIVPDYSKNIGEKKNGNSYNGQS